jgi:hypothetical protein
MLEKQNLIVQNAELKPLRHLCRSETSLLAWRESNLNPVEFTGRCPSWYSRKVNYVWHIFKKGTLNTQCSMHNVQQEPQKQPKQYL